MRAKMEKGRHLSQVGLGVAGEGLRGCRASKQMVRQVSTNRHGCPCRLHPANITTLGWDWTLVKFIMEQQVLGTLCVTWGRAHPAHAA